jgi:hypothetical protein
MTAFLAKLPESVTRGIGSITTSCVLLQFPRAIVQSALPRGLTLLDEARGQALVVLLLSRNHFTTWFGEMRYLELILGLPNVSAGDGVPSMYMRRLYLDQRLPRLLGNYIHGYEKLPAKIRWEGTVDRYEYRVEDRFGGLLLDATFGLAPQRDQPLEAGLARMWGVLAQPIVSQARRRLSARAALEHGGPFLRSTITYDSSTAVTRPVAGRIRFGAAFDPAVFAGLELETPALGAEGAGAVVWHAGQVVTLPVRIARTRPDQSLLAARSAR